METYIGYLFSRFHHLLGFERVLEFRSRFPDVIALRDGSKIRIELESKLSNISSHFVRFRVMKPYCRPLRVGKDVVIYNRGPVSLGWAEERRIHDPEENLFWTELPGAYEIRCKSLKLYVDVVICGNIDSPGVLKRLEEEGIEVIDLPSKLKELGVSWGGRVRSKMCAREKV